jgi:hypothetical protein
VVLPSLVEPGEAALGRYIAALERELEQVQNWARELERIAQSPRRSRAPLSPSRWLKRARESASGRARRTRSRNRSRNRE